MLNKENAHAAGRSTSLAIRSMIEKQFMYETPYINANSIHSALLLQVLFASPFYAIKKN